MTAESVVKIADMGVSKINSLTTSVAYSYAGTRDYSSPEMLQCYSTDPPSKAKRSYSYKTDVWSLGCVLYEMMRLERAFSDSSQLENGISPNLGSHPIFSRALKK